jgi:hypothetical protein
MWTEFEAAGWGSEGGYTKARASEQKPPKVSRMKGTKAAPSDAARAEYLFFLTVAAAAAARRVPKQDWGTEDEEVGWVMPTSR